MGTITIANPGKACKQYPTRWSRLAEWLVPFSKPRHQLKWVLQIRSLDTAITESGGASYPSPDSFA